MLAEFDSSDDTRQLHELGYEPELRRELGGFSNFALSFSIICILAGGVTSFHLGLGATGGASIGLGWPLVSLFSLCVAMTMAQVASAFPTAGGLYHWASLLGGKGWGWATAWFNLVGLVTVISAVNVGAWTFIFDSFLGAITSNTTLVQFIGVGMITISQAMLNHRGIRLTTRLTNLSGYLILLISIILTVGMIVSAESIDLTRLWTFSNNSGAIGKDVWPRSESLTFLFALGLLLPAYTLTGFDASAHAAEETRGASRVVPLGIVRSVAVSSVAGWIVLGAVVASVPSLEAMVAQGTGAFPWALQTVLPRPLATSLGIGIALAMYGCGLGAVTSASRMAFAFARDGGLPFSGWFRKVGRTSQTPANAIWMVALGSWLFTIWTPFYATITAVATIFLYISYVLPTALGAIAYQRSWTRMGPWNLGWLYRPLALISVVGCAGLIVVGMQPPNEKSIYVVAVVLAALFVAWFAGERKRFAGPPVISIGAIAEPARVSE